MTNRHPLVIPTLPIHGRRFTFLLVTALLAASPACKKTENAATVDPAAAAPAAVVAPNAPPASTPTTPTAAPAAAPAPAPSVETPPAADAPPPVPPPTAEADDGVKPLGTHVLPGMVVRETLPRTPERAVQDVLRASLEVDENKGWEMFKSLLHTDELLPNALITRRSMNYAASRRKVDLFLVEKADMPVFKVARILDEGNDSLRFFVHNRESMPTPCTARIDHNLKPPQWKIGICSL